MNANWKWELIRSFFKMKQWCVSVCFLKNYSYKIHLFFPFPVILTSFFPLLSICSSGHGIQCTKHTTNLGFFFVEIDKVIPITLLMLILIVWSLSIHHQLSDYIMLVKLKQNLMVCTIQISEFFEKKMVYHFEKALTPFWKTFL